jgi:peptidyl-prolyl cis-trans isomerase B (cyclophilin B)
MKNLIFLWLLFMMTATWAKEVPVVELQTNLGKIVLELNPQQAPKTVENFLSYAKSGFYEGTIFHRVINHFMIQGGGYTQDLTKKTTRPPIANEANNGLKNQKGTVAMARTADPDSATSQFFINMADNHFLDHQAPTDSGWGYTVFGQVIQGMDVLNQIQVVKTGSQGPFQQDVPEKAITIQKVTINHAQPTASVDTTEVPPEPEKRLPPAKTEDKVEPPQDAEQKDAKKTAAVKETTPPEVKTAQHAGVEDSTKKIVETSPKPMPVEVKPTEPKAEIKTPVEDKTPPAEADKGKDALLAPDAPTKPDTPESPPS